MANQQSFNRMLSRQLKRSLIHKNNLALSTTNEHGQKKKQHRNEYIFYKSTFT